VCLENKVEFIFSNYPKTHIDPTQGSGETEDIHVYATDCFKLCSPQRTMHFLQDIYKSEELWIWCATINISHKND